MPRFVTVAQSADIPPGERDVFEIDGLYIAVFNVGGTYYAINENEEEENSEDSRDVTDIVFSPPSLIEFGR